MFRIQTRAFSSSARTLRSVQKLGVLGAGQMGLGIALVAAKVAQTPVTLVDSSEKSLEKGMAFMGMKIDVRRIWRGSRS